MGEEVRTRMRVQMKCVSVTGREHLCADEIHVSGWRKHFCADEIHVSGWREHLCAEDMHVSNWEGAPLHQLWAHSLELTVLAFLVLTLRCPLLCGPAVTPKIPKRLFFPLCRTQQWGF